MALGCRGGGEEVVGTRAGWSPACLLAGGLLHFADSSPEQLIQTVGAVGVSLKWFGLLDWMRSFSRTGPLVRMITVVTQDIG
eukprot:COSAG04_NODE_5477_length_1602_cov_2.314039_3_plen_82_part_00